MTLAKGARWVIATWLVLVGIVYAVQALGLTSSRVSLEWTWMAFAIVCLKVATLIARDGLIRPPPPDA